MLPEHQLALERARIGAGWAHCAPIHARIPAWWCSASIAGAPSCAPASRGGRLPPRIDRAGSARRLDGARCCRSINRSWSLRGSVPDGRTVRRSTPGSRRG